MSLSSDEILVSQGAKSIVAAASGINLTGVQQCIIGDETGVSLPALVFSADLKGEESGTSLAREYDLKMELRWLTGFQPTAGEDDIMERACEALCPFGENSMGSPPNVITVNFDYFRVEKEASADFSQGQRDDMNTRSRMFQVFAKLK